MPDPLDEQTLIRHAVDDPDAFQELYHRYVRRVYGYVASRLPHTQDAEDVVADVFLRVIKNLDQLRNRQPASFPAWLFVIVRHTVADHYRQNGQAANHLSLDNIETPAPSESQPDHVLSERAEAVMVRQLISQLPERQREIVTLRYYAGLRNQEIATVLGIGEKTVSGYLSRALNDLRQRYSATLSQEVSANHE
jgi:RNA polymerase sigma-70 factor (ECF subfamily)